MKRIFSASFVVLLILLQAFGQQIQTLDEVDSHKIRREKTNANFQAIVDRINANYNSLNNGKESKLTFSGPLSRAGDVVSCPTCMDTSSSQDLSNKRLISPSLNVPILEGVNRSSLPTATAGGFTFVNNDVGGAWVKGRGGKWYHTGAEEVNVEEYSSLSAAISDIGTSTQRTVVIPNSQAVPASLTIPRNVALRVTGNGKFNISSGVTLTIDGPFDAPLRQVFTGGGVVRWGGQIGVVYPQWWGASLDGVTDDTAAIQKAIDSWPQTSSLHAGGVVELFGASVITSTLTIQKNSIKLTSTGWGISSEDPKSGYLKWEGAAGSPMVLIRDCYNSGVEDLRLIGKSTAKPSAGIEYRRTTGSPTLLHHCYARRVFVGPLFGYDSDNARQFDAGILLGGSVDGDTCYFEQVHVSNCTIGVDAQNGNASVTSFNELKVTECGTGVKSNTFINGSNWNFGVNGLDMYVTSGHRIQVKEISSEESDQMAVVEVAGQLYIEGGSFQVTPGIVASGYLVDADQSARVRLVSFDFTLGPGYAFSPLYKIRVKSAGGSSGAQYLKLDNVTGIQEDQVDVTGPFNAYSHRTIVQFTRPPDGAHNFGANAVNFLTSDEPFDEMRFDVAGALNALGGPLRVRKLSAPAGLAVTKVGSGTGTTYSYRVSAVAADGTETDASSAVTISGPASLSPSVYNEITWYPVAGAVAYKVYGRNGTEQLLGTRNAYDIHTKPAQGLITSFKDDGSITPSGALPVANTTGNAVVSGTLTVGGGTAITQVLSATATLDFPSTGAQTSSDLTITLMGAALGDVVALGVPNEAAWVGGNCFTAWVSDVDTVTIRFNNFSAFANDPDSGVFRVMVTKF